jgi:23S rRNA (adenine2503-C2)-methyltransferase
MPERPVFATDLDPAAAAALMARLGQPAFRARQLLNWIYRKRAASFSEMTDFPLALREKLAGEMELYGVQPLEIQSSQDGTQKALLELCDGRTIETALMPASKPGLYTVCVSSQVGCAMGCTFCATGDQGFQRNLTPGEIVDQVLFFARRLGDQGVVSNVVFMGMGEPLSNYADTMLAVERLNADWGFGLAARAITISSAGWIPGIEKLSQETLQVGLAVSLHAATDLLRTRLMPLNKKHPLSRLIPACKEYVRLSGRRVSFEYCLLAGVNDSLEQARELAHLVQGMNCHVNLIAVNATDGDKFKPPAREVVLAFENELKRLGITATLRRSLGRDIDAACGQLKSRYSD